MSKVRINIKDIRKYVGQEIGASKWLQLTQGRVNKFAEATGDFQWTHMDQERAKTDLSGGQTIVHNYLLLSMIPQLFDQVVEFTGLRYGLNRGAENIHFMTPLATDCMVMIRVRLLKLEYLDQKGMTATFHIIMERESSDKAVMAMNLQLLFVVGVP